MFQDRKKLLYVLETFEIDLSGVVIVGLGENYDIVIKSFVKRHQNELKHLRMLTFMAVLFFLASRLA